MNRLRGFDEIVERICDILETLGYKPVIIGTYALMLQGWLPPGYIERTKDLDIYVDDPMVVFDERIEDRVQAIGLSLGRSESGGLYIDAEKPVEIVYPIHGIYVPRALLNHVVIVRGLRVLEGHATLVAKALGSNIDHLADIFKSRRVAIDPGRLEMLLEAVAAEIEPSIYSVLTQRIESFLRRYQANTRH